MPQGQKAKKLIYLATFLVLLIFGLSKANAAFNPQINYQGKLLNSSSQQVDDDKYNFQFRLCTDSDCASPVWTETHCYGDTCDGTGTDNRVNVTSSLFSVLLGDLANLNSVDFNQTLYLELQVGGTSTADVAWETLLPRKKLGAVPAAFEALRLDGHTWEAPGALGGTTASSAIFTNATATLWLRVVGNSYFGTVASGTWQGAAVSSIYGGTGQNSSAWTGLARVTGGVWSTSTVSLTTDINGTLSVTNGGTGTSTAPSLGQLLIGNTVGGYNFITTSSLGLLASESDPIFDALPAAKGDIFTATANDTPAILSVGTDGKILVASSTATNGIAWEPTSVLGFVDTDTTSSPAGSTGQIQFNNAGFFGATTTFVWDDANGRLGIGTTTPNELLNVFGGNSPTELLVSVNNSYDAGISLMESGGSSGGADFGTAGGNGFRIIHDGGDNKLYIQSGNTVSVTTVMAVDRITGYVGIGTTTPGAKLTVAGDLVATGTIKTVAGGSAGTGLQQLASELYVQSRGMNLITNGSGLLGNNYNFTSFTFDQSDTHGGKGSFKYSTYSGGPISDEYIPVDGTKTYKLSLWAKATTYAAGAHAYFGVVLYDIDGLSVSPIYFMRIAGTDTTLAADLNPTDTVVHLTSGANWSNSSAAYNRQIQIWDWTNSFGYTYPAYTYSRHTSINYSNYASNGAWAIGEAGGNDITLTEPWPAALGTIPAGTAVSNGSAGSTYKYIAASNVVVPAEWTNYTGLIGGWDTTGSNAANLFPYGTASAKLLFLMNRDVAGNVTNVSDLWFSELTPQNLALASSTIYVGNASGTATGVTMSGDAALTSTGVLSISANAVGSSEIINNSITPADLASSTAPSAVGNVLTYNGSTFNWAPTSTLGLLSAAGWTDDGASVRLTTISDKVGIGTTIPLTKLQVGIDTASEPITLGSLTPQVLMVGSVNSTTQDSILRFVRPTAGGISYPASVDFKMSRWEVAYPYPRTQLTIGLKASGSYDSGDVVNVMTLRDNGNVGIGTTTPAARLVIKGSGVGNVAIGEWAGDTSYAGLGLAGSLSSTNYNFISSPSDTNLFINRPAGNNIQFREANATQVIIQANTGNVGIGTTTPVALLSFPVDTTAAGGINFGGDVNLYRSAENYLATGDSFSVNGAYLNMASGGGTIILGAGGLSGGGDIVFRSSGAPSSVISPVFRIKDSTGSLQDGLRFSPAWIDSTPGTLSDTITVSSLGTDIFTMSANQTYSTVGFAGDVGIGTTTPSFTLTVAGNMSVTGTLRVGNSADPGTSGYILRSNGSSAAPTWVATSSMVGTLGTMAYQNSNTVAITGGTITGITDLTVADGGTGASTLTDGGILFGNGTSAIGATAVLTNGQLLIGDGTTEPTLATLTQGSGITISNGAGSISIAHAAHTGDVTGATALTIATDAVHGTMISIASEGNGSLMYHNGTDWVNLAAGTAGYVLKANGAAAPTWVATSSMVGTLGTMAYQNSNTVAITGGTITGITDLTVADGGTGASTLTDGGILFGNGTSAIGATAVLTNGQLLIGDGTTEPTLATLTQGSGITISNGAGSISIAHAAHTGDVTGATALTIATDAVHGTMISIASEGNGSLMYHNGTDWVNLAAGTAGYVLKANGAAAPTWVATNTLGLPTGTGSAGYVAFWNGANSLTYDNGNFFWDTSLIRLGVGTSTPRATLDVAGKIAINGDPFIYLPDQNTYPGTMYVGVGGGGSALSAGGTYNTYVGKNAGRYNSSGDSNTGIGHSALYSNTTGQFNTAVGLDSLQFNTSGSGNVALGEDALNSNETGFYNVAIGLGALRRATSSSGNIAIGWDASFVNIAPSTTAIGYLALYSNTVGEGNTAVGYQTLYNNGDPDTKYAKENTAVGFQALYANTSGLRNDAFGYQALYANTSGNYNTAFGSIALDANISGEENTASGYSSLGANTTGSYNVGYGAYSLGNNATGLRNTAIGNKALLTNTAASDNVAVGFETLYTEASGTNNTALGTQALRTSNGGNYNTGVGFQSLYDTTTGDYNTAIGYLAGTAIQGGSYNTMLGANAGVGTATNYAVAIGYNASNQANSSVLIGYNASTTGGNSVVIGSGAGAITGSTGWSNIAIGDTAQITGSGLDEMIAIGRAAAVSGTHGIAIGGGAVVTASYGIAIGDGATVGTAYNIVLGAENAGSDLYLGGTSGLGSIYFTPVVTASTKALCYDGSGASWLDDCSGTPVADYMEYYAVDNDVSMGDVVVMSDTYVSTTDGNTIPKLSKATSSYNNQVIGILSDKEGANDFNSTAATSINEEDNPDVLALSGRITVKVTTDNGPIFKGDKLTSSDRPGYAMKATEEGPTVGIAMGDFSGSVTGTMMVFVNLSWNNTIYKGLTLDTNLNELKIKTPTLSFATTTFFNSYVSSSLGNTNAFIMNAVNFNTSTQNNYILSLRSNNSPVFSVSSNGDVISAGNIYASSMVLGTSTNPGDLAERVDINPNESVEAGDVMMVDPNYPDQYQKTNMAYEPTVAGVISTNPTIIVGNGKTNQTAPLAMVGRVPVKITTINGLIKRGDLLVASNIPGTAMKYDPANDDSQKIVGIIGIALDNAGDSNTGKVMALIRTGWVYNKTEALVELQNQIGNMSDEGGELLIPEGGEDLTVTDDNGTISYSGSGNLNLSGSALINVSYIVSPNNAWAINEFGLLIARVTTSEGDKNIYGMSSESAEITISGTGTLQMGEVVITFNTSTQEIIDESQPIKVNVTLTSLEALSGIAVIEKSTQGFKVKELNNGTSSSTFDWIVIAKRKMLNLDVEITPIEIPPVETAPVETTPTETTPIDTTPVDTTPTETTPTETAPVDTTPTETAPVETTSTETTPIDTTPVDTTPTETTPVDTTPVDTTPTP